MSLVSNVVTGFGLLVLGGVAVSALTPATGPAAAPTAAVAQVAQAPALAPARAVRVPVPVLVDVRETIYACQTARQTVEQAFAHDTLQRDYDVSLDAQVACGNGAQHLNDIGAQYPVLASALTPCSLELTVRSAAFVDFMDFADPRPGDYPDAVMASIKAHFAHADMLDNECVDQLKEAIRG
jgi:hypothetical protein